MINKKEFYDICPILQGPEGVSTHNINLERKFYNQKWCRKKKGLPSSSLVPIVFFSLFFYCLLFRFDHISRSHFQNIKCRAQKWEMIFCIMSENYICFGFVISFGFGEWIFTHGEQFEQPWKPTNISRYNLPPATFIQH